MCVTFCQANFTNGSEIQIEILLFSKCSLLIYGMHTHTLDTLTAKCPWGFPLVQHSSLVPFLLAHICSLQRHDKEVPTIRISVPEPLGLSKYSGFQAGSKKILLSAKLSPSQVCSMSYGGPIALSAPFQLLALTFTCLVSSWISPASFESSSTVANNFSKRREATSLLLRVQASLTFLLLPLSPSSINNHNTSVNSCGTCKILGLKWGEESHSLSAPILFESWLRLQKHPFTEFKQVFFK